MKYKKKLLEIVFDKNEKALPDWLFAQPLLEQVDILKEFKQMTFQNMFKSQDFSISETLKEFTTKIEEYEIAVLVELEAESAYNKAQEDLDKTMLEIDKRVDGVRNYVIDCIVNNEENAEPMKELAEKLMQSEKDNEMFDPKNWSRII